MTNIDEVDQNEIKYLGDVQRLHLAPDDIIVLSINETLSGSENAYIKHIIEEAAPEHKVIVLDRDTRIGILAPHD